MHKFVKKKIYKDN